MKLLPFYISYKDYLMNKSLIAVGLLAGVMSASVFADDGRINFYGSITDSACTVINNMTNPLSVMMGNVSSKAFTGAGSTASATKFIIALKDCPKSAKSATVKFDGTADSSVGTILALTQEPGVAQGVGIQLMDNKNVVVPLYTASSAYPLQPGENSLAFVARYYATSSTVNAGFANATSTFTLNYN